jgi:hypothetical protein
MRQVKFSPLEFTDSQVKVKWTVHPESIIYRQTSFTLDFGAALDPRTLPLKLWWTVVLLTIHSHWNLLRPCRVVLPVSLSAGEIEYWQRLLDLQRVTLEKYRGTADFERTIEIACDGPVLAEENLPSPVERWATAFSGGKDSLVQTALLCELTERPLLVNVSSPMPPLIDNDWPYRDRTMNEIVRRRDVELVIVKSDLRNIWPHYEIPHKLGYQLSMGLLGDTHFYIAIMFAVAASRGVRRLSLAVEIENDQSEDYHGRTAFYDFNTTYALPLLMIIDRLLNRFGMEFGSLLIPFNHYQIEKLIRKRYADLADLQISCFWMEKPTERSCSRCAKCIRIAMLLLSMGEDPATLDIDLTRMFTPPYNYDPIKTMLGGRTMAYAAAKIDKSAARQFFPVGNLLERLVRREPQAFREFKQVVDGFAAYTKPEIEMTHLEYFRYIPEALRDRIKAISLQYWPDCDQTTYVPNPLRIDPLVEWVTQTL